mgnify:CR=1 FL=1
MFKDYSLFTKIFFILIAIFIAVAVTYFTYPKHYPAPASRCEVGNEVSCWGGEFSE